MKTHRTFAIWVGAGLFIHGASAQISNTPISFQPLSVTALPPTAAPSDIAVGDFDHDGMRDVAVSERGLDRVAVYLQANAGGFVTPAAATAPAGQAPSSLVACSLTPNGYSDDLMVISGPDGSVTPIMNSWPATPFALNPLTPSAYRINFRGQNPRLVPAFFNKSNPLTSFVIADDQSLRPGALFARYVGGSTFGYPIRPLSPGGITAPPNVSAYDVDGDAYLDLLTTSPDNNQVVIFYNNICAVGCWSEGYSAMLPSGGTYPVDVQAIDLNADSHADIITANAGTPNFTYSLNLTGWQFNAPVAVPLPAAPRRLLMVELNNDYLPDMLVLCADNAVRVFRNTGQTGAGRFVLDATLATGADPTAMAVADINSDQLPDIAVSCAGDNTVRVYRGVNAALSTRPRALAGVTVFPNPATDYLTLTLPASGSGSVQARLFDALGRPVLQHLVPTGQTTLSTAALARGMYTLQLVAPEGIYTHRVILD